MRISDLMIGGVAPAVLLGISTVLIRYSATNGASTPIFLAVVGAAVALAGGLAAWITGDVAATPKAVAGALAMGLTWSAAVACMSYGFATLRLPVSVVAPLTNSNALVAVAFAAVLFGEWKTLSLPHVIIGTLLIGVGATLVSVAK